MRRWTTPPEIVLRRSTGSIAYFVRDIWEVHSRWLRQPSPPYSVWEVLSLGENHILVNITTGKQVPFEDIHSVEVRKVVVVRTEVIQVIDLTREEVREVIDLT